MDFSLHQFFEELNHRHFDGFLDPLPLHWNSRLRTSAGRFIPGSRKWYLQYPPKIELASYLMTEPNAEELIRDTLGHEMIHYWLWMRRRPYGHTDEFYAKMQQMGVSRYNPVPRIRPYKWVYRCESCLVKFPVRRRLSKKLACLKCCQRFAGGRYDVRFKLVFEGPYISPETQTCEVSELEITEPVE